MGETFGNEDFQLAIKKSVGKGELFKAYPTCFVHTHAPLINSTLRQTEAFMDVVISGAKKGLLMNM